MLVACIFPRTVSLLVVHWHDHQPADIAYLSDIRVTSISTSFTHKMASETSCVSCIPVFPYASSLRRVVVTLLTAVLEISDRISRCKKVKVAHTQLPSVGFRSRSQFLAVSLHVTWVINPAVGCHYFLPGPQLPSQPLRGLLPVLLLGEQRHDGCEQFA